MTYHDQTKSGWHLGPNYPTARDTGCFSHLEPLKLPSALLVTWPLAQSGAQQCHESCFGGRWHLSSDSRWRHWCCKCPHEECGQVQQATFDESPPLATGIHSEMSAVHFCTSCLWRHHQFKTAVPGERLDDDPVPPWEPCGHQLAHRSGTWRRRYLAIA